jgi:hypothetical protein
LNEEAEMTDDAWRLEALYKAAEHMDEAAKLIRSVNNERLNSYCLAALEGKGAWLGHFERDYLNEEIAVIEATYEGELCSRCGKAVPLEEGGRHNEEDNPEWCERCNDEDQQEQLDRALGR